MAKRGGFPGGMGMPGNMNNLMKQAQRMQRQMEEGQKELEVKEFSAKDVYKRQGMGFLVIPEKDVPEFKKLLVQYYEGEPLEVIGAFLKERCWKNF